MNDTIKISSTRLLLVEGNDELWFFKQLLQYLNLNQTKESLDIQIIDVEGRTKFASLLSLLSKSPDFSKVRAIGFVRDAEENTASSSYASMTSAIKKCIPHFPIPPIGSVIKDGNIACGIFIMPNNADAGMLEDMCMQSVCGEPLYEHAQKYVEEAHGLLPASDQKKHNTHKAMVQTYLAGQPEIVNSIANAAKKGFWDFSNPVFAGVADFVRTLAVI